MTPTEASGCVLPRRVTHCHVVCRGEPNECGPMYINIGDGGNREGLNDFLDPQPEWSAVREPSYGHGATECVDFFTARGVGSVRSRPNGPAA